MSDNIYSVIGTIVVWIMFLGIGAGGLAFAYVLFDNWILRPRREAIFKAGQLDVVGHIARNSYWFSEHPPTANLLRDLIKVYSEGMGQPIDQIRQNWRKDMGEMP